MKPRPARIGLVRYFGFLCCAFQAHPVAATEPPNPEPFLQRHIGDVAFDLPQRLELDETGTECTPARCERIWRDGAHHARLLRERQFSNAERSPTSKTTNPLGLKFEIDALWDIPPKKQAKAVGIVDGHMYTLTIDLGDDEWSDYAANRFAMSFRSADEMRGLELVEIAADLSNVRLRNHENLEFDARTGDWLGDGVLSEIRMDYALIRPTADDDEHAAIRVLHPPKTALPAYRLHHVIGYVFELPSQFPMQVRTWDHTVDSRDKSWSSGDQHVWISAASHIGSPDGPELVNTRGDRYLMENTAERAHLKLIDESLHIFVALGDPEKSLIVARHLIDTLRHVDGNPGDLELLEVSPDHTSVRIRNEAGVEYVAHVDDEVAEHNGILTKIHADHVDILQFVPDGKGWGNERLTEIRITKGSGRPTEAAGE